MKRILPFMFVLCLSFQVLFSSAAAESAATAEPIPEPTLNPNAEKYDESHPEDLLPDQLYALSAILVVEDTARTSIQHLTRRFAACSNGRTAVCMKKSSA